MITIGTFLLSIDVSFTLRANTSIDEENRMWINSVTCQSTNWKRRKEQGTCWALFPSLALWRLIFSFVLFCRKSPENLSIRSIFCFQSIHREKFSLLKRRKKKTKKQNVQLFWTSDGFPNESIVVVKNELHLDFRCSHLCEHRDWFVSLIREFCDDFDAQHRHGEKVFSSNLNERKKNVLSYSRVELFV